MCGRYEVKLADCDGIMCELMAKSGTELEKVRDGEARPGDLAPVICMEKYALKAVSMRWGFEGPKGLVINARAETAAERPMFQGCVKAFRCLLPACGYFEWHQRSGAKYRVELKAEKQFYMAGLYLPQPDGPARYVVLTRAADEAVREIHPRMPLILTTEEERMDWLSDARKAERLLTEAGIPELTAWAEEPEQLSMFDGLM